jgi:alkylhydroperoxidase/carboxymuconolactone decarboxylase family protein YurZ
MHIKKSIDAGVTREQIIEAAGVAVMMQGGPGYVHLPMILEALDAIGA